MYDQLCLWATMHNLTCTHDNNVVFFLNNICITAKPILTLTTIIHVSHARLSSQLLAYPANMNSLSPTRYPIILSVKKHRDGFRGSKSSVNL